MGNQLCRGRRRHLALAGAADDAADAGCDPGVMELDPQAPEGIHHGHAGHGVGHDRCVPGDGPGALLCIFRADAFADVPDHRRVGREEPNLCGHQVFSIHHRRLASHAPRHHLSRIPAGPSDAWRRADVRDHAALRTLAPASHSDDPLLCVRPGVRHQGSALPPAHLAAGRARRGPHGRVDHSGRRHAENGDVRLPPFCAAVLP